MNYGQEINKSQNSPEMIRLLLAADVAHRRAARLEGARALTVAVLALGAIVAAFYPSLAGVLAVIGVAGALFTEFVGPLRARHWTRMAMILQERFDTGVFEMQWDRQIPTGPLDETVTEWARAFKGTDDNLRDWYVDVAGLPRAHAILICQRQNLAWDARQRDWWGQRVGVLTTAWLLVGIAAALGADWTVRDLFVRWMGPSLPLLALGFRQAHGHLSISREKQAMALRIETLLAEAPAGTPKPEDHDRLLHEARQLQTALATQRSRLERVPPRVHAARRDIEELSAQEKARALKARLLG